MSDVPDSVVTAVVEAREAHSHGTQTSDGITCDCGATYDDLADAYDDLADAYEHRERMVADAAWAASLESAAERLGEAGAAWTYIAAAELRRWAGEQERGEG